MIALEQASQHLETLGLKQAVEILDNTLDAAANNKFSGLLGQRPWKFTQHGGRAKNQGLDHCGPVHPGVSGH